MLTHYVACNDSVLVGDVLVWPVGHRCVLFTISTWEGDKRNTTFWSVLYFYCRDISSCTLSSSRIHSMDRNMGWPNEQLPRHGD